MKSKSDKIVEAVKTLTLPSYDNRIHFTNFQRLNSIQESLAESRYILTKGKLLHIYRHFEFDPRKPTILFSSHVDSCYRNHFAKESEDLLIGTFDNSATNAIITELMRENNLNPQTLIAFTGDEEIGSKGAVEVMKYCKKEGINPTWVVVTDITEEGWKEQVEFTLENLFIKENNLIKRTEISNHIMSLLSLGEKKVVILDGAADEAYMYVKYIPDNVNGVFSYCLPCGIINFDMHDEEGVEIRKQSLVQYSEVLEKISQYLFESSATTLLLENKLKC